MTIFKPTIYFAHWIDADRMGFPVPVCIYNVHAGIPSNPHVFNVLNISNESQFTRMSNKMVLEVAQHYNLILTWDEEILSQCPNAVKFMCGMTWIRELDMIHIKRDKLFKVTTFCTSKNLTENHNMRHRLWNRQKEIGNISTEFWNSSHHPMSTFIGNPMLSPEPHEKIIMFYDSQFHITIENGCIRNYFTEKLMDCFITRTIPIYVGCPNIGDFFNIDGIISCNNEYEIIAVCNELTEDYYQNHLLAIEDNFNRCQEYCGDFTNRLQEVISKYV